MRAESTTLPSSRTEPRLRWWKEVIIIGLFYVGYSAIRNQFGSAQLDIGGVPEQAFNHALDVIDLEHSLGTYFEHRLQAVFLDNVTFMQFWNVFYGTAHFIVTMFTFVCLFTFARPRFVRWRNTLACTTGLALVGFSTFPLMPPRLLTDSGRFGGAGQLSQVAVKVPVDFVDGLRVFGGAWSFDSGPMTRITNQYAAMPSLHCAWALWCCLALWPLFDRPWQRVLLVAYPWATLFCIIVTGNHYWIDAVGGLVTLGLGFLAGSLIDGLNQRRLARKFGSSAVANQINEYMT